MTTHPVHIIGGGLGGLVAAAYLTRSDIPVVVHESTGRLGGRARTAITDGFAFNLGPHALSQGGEAVAALAELGIRASGARPSSSAIVVRDGRPLAAPTNPIGLARTRALGGRDKVALAALMTRLPRLDATSEATTTVADWLDRVAPRPRMREVLDALVRLATYAHAPDQLSAEVAILQLQRASGPGVRYLDHGWQSLVDALTTSAGCEIRTGEPRRELPDAAEVIVAVGGPEATGRLVGHRFDVGPPATVSTLDLGFAGPSPIGLALGLDVPLYASTHSIARGIAPHGHGAISVAEYLAPGVDPDRARLAEFARTVGVADDAVRTQRYLHRMTAVDAIATVDRGGLAGRPDVAAPGHDGVFIVGDWVGPDGHLVDAVFASARRAARAVITRRARLGVG